MHIKDNRECHNRYQRLNNKMHTYFSNALFDEYLYLAILALFLLYYSVGTIKYPDSWIRLDYNFIHSILIVYVVFKYTLIGRPALKKIEWGLAVLMLFSFIFAFQHTWYAELFDTAFLILGAKNIRTTSILKIYLVIKAPFIIATMICSQWGILENLIYNQNGRIRESYGFVYPTDFAAQVFFVIVAWIFLRQAATSVYELTAISAIALFLKYKCDTRCSVLSILLVVLGVALLKILSKYRSALLSSSLMTRGFGICCMISPYIFAGTMIFACRFYNPDNAIMAFFDKITSQRLRLGKKTFDNYDVRLFGQYIEMHGNGGSTQKPVDYTFIDSSYNSILMRYGLMVFAIVLLLITFLMVKNYQNMIVLYLLVLICLHSMMEHHLFEIHYNFSLLLPFAVAQKRLLNFTMGE